jgi:hypothetical protein
MLSMSAYPLTGQFLPCPLARDLVRSSLSTLYRRQFDSRVKAARRVLTASFNFADHDWSEPARRAVKAANENNVGSVIPRASEIVITEKSYSSYSWWEEVEQSFYQPCCELSAPVNKLATS